MAARVGHRSAHPGVAAGITPGQVAEARKDLGRRLAAWRMKSGLTQVELARRTRYSRSTVANMETGRRPFSRLFWHRVDAVFGAGGELLAAFDQMDALARDFQTQANGRRAEQRQQQRAVQYAAAGGEAPHECGCAGIAVGRWTGREIRALREALRMSVRVFAEYIGMSTAAVSGWEHRHEPSAPTLAAQALLDQALKLADPDAKTRFGLILAAPGSAGATCAPQVETATSGSVTPIHRPELAAAAS
jgi:DNA-binding transcriptional regulator YiaG